MTGEQKERHTKNKRNNKRTNYRSITCLSTSYKMITSILTERIVNFFECKDIFPLEEKRC